MSVLDILNLVWLGALTVIVLAAAVRIGWLAGYRRGRVSMAEEIIAYKQKERIVP